MLRYCSYCQETVEAEGHTHPEKKCQNCQQVKLLKDFPIHKSSLDGHRHTCIVCCAQEKQQQKQAQVDARQRREQENTLFKAYGYRWRKDLVLVDDFYEEERWVLYSPQKKPIKPGEALEEIAQLQVHHPDHPVTLWAKGLIQQPNVVFLDTETTGIGAEDEIIEIAIVDVTGHTRLNTLVQCQAPFIPPEAKSKHHINEMMLRGAPTFPQFWDKMMRFLVTKEIIIYNAQYDVKMLQQTATRYHLSMPELHTHCLMKQYSSYVEQPTGYRPLSLAAACLHFHIPQTSAHRALADTLASLEVLRALAKMAW